ncbi:MAG: cobyrinate a,c-diamide synthase [Acidiferrobacter sp.]
MPRLLISAAHKSSGKTTVTLGLAAALNRRGVHVQTFKKGPDYIDPLWLGLASGRPCRNLDFYLMSPDEIGAMVADHTDTADLALIEGNKGLYDGLDLDGSNSNAALSALLCAPVVLVIDVRGMTRGIAPLILGYQQFDPNIRIGGVILNQIGGARHEGKLRAAIEHYTDVPVLGAVHYDPKITLTERHLGLVPGNEIDSAARRIAEIGAVMGGQIDLDQVLAVATSASLLPFVTAAHDRSHAQADVRIGIAQDAAFGFYYPDDLDALRAAGAELVSFDTLQDVELPVVDALFIGGGFPETHMAALERNTTMRTSVRAAVEGGLPVYAECGGLMYLARSISWQDRQATMVGAIPADIVMHDRPIGRGYVRLKETGMGPWPQNAEQSEIRAHEFHYSSVENLPSDTRFAYEVLRGYGVDGRHDGILYKNVLASYTHLRDVTTNHWAERFVRYVRHQRTQKPSALGTDLC